MSELVLTVLAVPAKIIIWVVTSLIRGASKRAGLTKTCEVCRTTFPTVGRSECPECGRVEVGSFFECSCGASYDAMSCSTCGVTIDK